MSIPSFKELLRMLRPGEEIAPRMVLALDPGETTGWAVFEEGNLIDVGEAGGKGVKVEEQGLQIRDIMGKYVPDYIIVEDYFVYGHKAKAHSWASLYTPRLIGILQFLSTTCDARLVMQTPSSKQFCTNDKLRSWNMYKTGSAHINDAVRHGCYWLLFNKEVG